MVPRLLDTVIVIMLQPVRVNHGLALAQQHGETVQQSDITEPVKTARGKCSCGTRLQRVGDGDSA